MKITGYKLRERLKNLELKRENLQRQFHGTLYAFPEEIGKKRLPLDIGTELASVESAIAKHQAAQVEYNLKVKVTVLEGTISLAEAVKSVGGATRLIELWKHADREVNTAAERVRVRRKDDEMIIAQAQVTTEETMAMVQKAEQLAASLRSAIAEGNSVPVDLETQLS